MEGTNIGPVLSFRYYVGLQPPKQLLSYPWLGIYVAASIMWSVLFFCGISQYTYDSDVDEVIDDTVLFIQIFLTQFGVLREIYNRKKLRSLIQDLEEIDKILSNMDAPVNYMLQLNYYSFFIFVVGIFLFTIYELYIGGIKWNVVVVCLLQQYYESIVITYSLFNIGILRMIISQLESIANLLNHENAFACESAVMLHNRLWRRCQKFNNYQGWNNFSFIVYNFLEAILNVFFILSPSPKGTSPYILLGWCFYRSFHVLQFITTCLWTSDQNDNFLHQLHKTFVNYKPSSQDENDIISCYVLMDRKIQFDANGFFSLSTSMFLGALSASFTYIVLMMQTVDSYC